MKHQHNAIQDILKVANQPHIISLAGGLPAPESFPTEIIQNLASTVITKYGTPCLQYGPTQGMPVLLEALTKYLAKKSIATDSSHLLVSNGSQSLLDLLGRVLLTPSKNLIAVEKPTYLGALQAFSSFSPHYAELETDEEGVVPASLKNVITKYHPMFVYLNPTFQNPTGKTIPLKRRIEMGKIIEESKTLVIEDDPYSELRYRGEAVKPLWVCAPEYIVYVSTFSKILSPGLRLGFCVAPHKMIEQLISVKQGSDLHTNSLSQAIATEYVEGGYLKKQLPKIISIYKPRLDAMLDSLKRHMPTEYTWTQPQGGMFVWVTGPKNINTLSLYKHAIEKGVAFVPGEFFYATKGEGSNTMRLNFTNVSEEKIEKGIKILASLL